MFEFDFSGEIFKWQGEASWHFIPLPPDMSDEINRWCRDMKAARGSIRVEATIGTTSWKTSLFPDKSRGTYLLPVKAEVRRAERVTDGDEVDVKLAI